MDNYEGLIIKSNGRLIESKWVYDDKRSKGQYEETDITTLAFRYLFHECILAENLILRDIFLLINSQCKIFNLVLGNWCQELVDEVFKEENYPLKDNEISYLEIYRQIEIEDDYTCGFGRPDFHGIGHTRTPYSLMCSSPYDLQSLPIQLNTTTPIYSFVNPNKWDRPPTMLLSNVSFTLGEILYAIIWEFSFFGSPKMREEKIKELNDMVKDIHNS